MILLIFKFNVYKSRGSGNLSFSVFLRKHVKIRNLKKGTALRNQRKMVIYRTCYAVWIRMQIIQNNKKICSNKTMLQHLWICEREGGFYNFFSVVNFTFKLLNRYCCVFHYVFCYCTFVLFLLFNFSMYICVSMVYVYCIYMHDVCWYIYMWLFTFVKFYYSSDEM